MAARSTALAPAVQPPPVGQPTAEIVTPYLHAALSILQTLEREIRARSARLGSQEDLAANALRTRGMELSAQIARLEMEARADALERRLGSAAAAGTAAPARQGSPDRGSAHPASATSGVREHTSSLRQKLIQAENDAKAYKSRLRATEGLEKEKKELVTRVADLERQLISRDAIVATHGTEVEELRRRAVVAEATVDALRQELKQDVTQKAAKRLSERDLTNRVAELEAKLQETLLDKATVRASASPRTAVLLSIILQASPSPITDHPHTSPSHVTLTITITITITLCRPIADGAQGGGV